MNAPLLILMYHGLQRSAQDRGRFDRRYSVAPATFAAQMACLRAQCGRAFLPEPGEPLLHGEQARIMVSFDDGDVSQAEIALPCLERLGLRGVFFITSGFVGQPGMVSRRQLRDLADAGMRIGGHGASHRFLSSLSNSGLAAELHESRDSLQQIIGRRVDWLALPGGRGDQRVLEAAFAAGYRAVFGSEPGDNRELGPGRPLQRVAISRGMSLSAFQQILAWQGASVRHLRWRYRLLQLPKKVFGDERYLRWREALMS